MSETQVTEQEFWKRIGQLDVYPQIVGKYPYESIFRDRNLKVHGRIARETVQGVTVEAHYVSS